MNNYKSFCQKLQINPRCPLHLRILQQIGRMIGCDHRDSPVHTQFRMCAASPATAKETVSVRRTALAAIIPMEQINFGARSSYLTAQKGQAAMYVDCRWMTGGWYSTLYHIGNKHFLRVQFYRSEHFSNHLILLDTHYRPSRQRSQELSQESQSPTNKQPGRLHTFARHGRDTLRMKITLRAGSYLYTRDPTAPPLL